MYSTIFDDDAVYELLEQVRTNVNDALDAIWNATHDETLWRTVHRLLSIDTEKDTTHKAVETCIDAVLEELGYEFCEECGERADSCTCEDPAEDETEAEESQA